MIRNKMVNSLTNNRLLRYDDSYMLEFNRLSHSGLSYMLPQETINTICAAVADRRLDDFEGKKYRRKLFSYELGKYGWVKYGGGTNREVYKHQEDQSVVLKIAIDSVARNNNPAEMYKQYWLAPYCSKMFDITPCGTIGLMERGDPITNRAQLEPIANELYELLETIIKRGIVLGDAGLEYFMNFVVRPGFGPVLCDYTNVFKLDPRKLKCRRFNPSTGKLCGGLIDYDLDTCSRLVCPECGGQYSAIDLAQEIETYDQLLDYTRSDDVMHIIIKDKNGKVVKEVKPSSAIIKAEMKREKEEQYQSQNTEFSVKVVRNGKEYQNNRTEYESVSNKIKVDLNSPTTQDNRVERQQIPERHNTIKVDMNENDFDAQISQDQISKPTVINVDMNEDDDCYPKYQLESGPKIYESKMLMNHEELAKTFEMESDENGMRKYNKLLFYKKLTKDLLEDSKICSLDDKDIILTIYDDKNNKDISHSSLEITNCPKDLLREFLIKFQTRKLKTLEKEIEDHCMKFNTNSPIIIEEPEIEELPSPEPTNNEESENEDEKLLTEIVEKTREELREIKEKEIESKITINGKPFDVSNYEEPQQQDEVIDVEEVEKSEDDYSIARRWDDRPQKKRSPKAKMSMDNF